MVDFGLSHKALRVVKAIDGLTFLRMLHILKKVIKIIINFIIHVDL
jgi:hypothetical protein